MICENLTPWNCMVVVGNALTRILSLTTDCADFSSTHSRLHFHLSVLSHFCRELFSVQLWSLQLLFELHHLFLQGTDSWHQILKGRTHKSVTVQPHIAVHVGSDQQSGTSTSRSRVIHRLYSGLQNGCRECYWPLAFSQATPTCRMCVHIWPLTLWLLIVLHSQM